MTEHVLGRNIVLRVDRIDPGDFVSNVKYWEASPPTEVPEDEQDGFVELTVTRRSAGLDVWLQGSNDLANWTTLKLLASTLGDVTTPETYTGQMADVGTQYVRVVYYANQIPNPRPVGAAFVLEATLTTRSGKPDA